MRRKPNYERIAALEYELGYSDVRPRPLPDTPLGKLFDEIAAVCADSGCSDETWSRFDEARLAVRCAYHERGLLRSAAAAAAGVSA